MPANINLASKIQKILPEDLVSFMQLAAETASRKGQHIFLVGGIVRDLLLGTANVDIDIVVEGDAISLSNDIPFVDKHINIHPDFGTAKLRLGKWTIDLATARSEIYTRPGALPIVTPGTLEKDLLRRDFTINGMAVSLNPANFGELIDPYKGISDLKRKLIRILHGNSFIDDATRIWRAVRYEQRLEFVIESETLRLLKRDLEMLDTISGDRIRHEIELVLREKQPEKAVARAVELGVMQKIYPSLQDNGWLKERYLAARELGLPESSLAVVYLALLTYHLQPGELEEFLLRLHFNKTISQVLKDTLSLKGILSSINRTEIAPSEVYFTLSKYSEPAIIANSLAIDSPSVEQNIDLYLTKLRHMKPRLNGDDLKRMQIPTGPEIKRILHLLHIARLDGKVNTKQGEIRLVSLQGYNPKNVL